MIEGRIFFKGNPWPEGHPIREFAIKAKVIDDAVWFEVSLKTEDYYAERELDDDDCPEAAGDWESPTVWGNFHQCSISTDESGGFRVCPVARYNRNFLDGLELEVDPDIDLIENEWDEFTFQIYLLGHDAVTKHHFRFDRMPGSDLFKVRWSAKIALAYVGDYDFDYCFSAEIANVPFPEILRET